jgi:DNA polymerase-3 subunit alpha
MAEFSHLHVHTQYSLLDGAIRVKDLFPKLKERGMDTVAVTDHGNMFGAIDLYTEAKAHDVKVIFGCETYVAAADLKDRTNRRNYHLVLLAENEVGYKNLSRTSTRWATSRASTTTRGSTRRCCASATRASSR